MRRLLRWLAPLLVLGCLDAFAPAGAVPFTPPAIYHTWWAAIEACAGLSGDFQSVAWYEVPGASYPCPAYDGHCEGWWQPPHSIYMAAGSVTDRAVAEHEMLHDLLQRGDHPPAFAACGVATQAAP